MNMLRVKITRAEGDFSIYTAPPSNATVTKQIARLNKAAQRKGIEATYEAATEADYRAYWISVKADIDKAKAEETVINQVRHEAWSGERWRCWLPRRERNQK